MTIDNIVGGPLLLREGQPPFLLIDEEPSSVVIRNGNGRMPKQGLSTFIAGEWEWQRRQR